MVLTLSKEQTIYVNDKPVPLGSARADAARSLQESPGQDPLPPGRPGAAVRLRGRDHGPDSPLGHREARHGDGADPRSMRSTMAAAGLLFHGPAPRPRSTGRAGPPRRAPARRPPSALSAITHGLSRRGHAVLRACGPAAAREGPGRQPGARWSPPSARPDAPPRPAPRGPAPQAPRAPRVPEPERREPKAAAGAAARLPRARGLRAAPAPSLPAAQPLPPRSTARRARREGAAAGGQHHAPGPDAASTTAESPRAPRDRRRRRPGRASGSPQGPAPDPRRRRTSRSRGDPRRDRARSRSLATTNQSGRPKPQLAWCSSSA